MFKWDDHLTSDHSLDNKTKNNNKFNLGNLNTSINNSTSKIHYPDDSDEFVKKVTEIEEFMKKLLGTPNFI